MSIEMPRVRDKRNNSIEEGLINDGELSNEDEQNENENLRYNGTPESTAITIDNLISDVQKADLAIDLRDLIEENLKNFQKLQRTKGKSNRNPFTEKISNLICKDYLNFYIGKLTLISQENKELKAALIHEKSKLYQYEQMIAHNEEANVKARVIELESEVNQLKGQIVILRESNATSSELSLFCREQHNMVLRAAMEEAHEYMTQLNTKNMEILQNSLKEIAPSIETTVAKNLKKVTEETEVQIVKEIQKTQNQQNTYAEMLNSNKPKLNHPPNQDNVVLLKQNVAENLKLIYSALAVDPRIQIRKIEAARDGLIKIRTDNNEKSEKVRELLERSTNITEAFKLGIPKRRNPHIIIYGFDDTDQDGGVVMRELQRRNDFLLDQDENSIIKAAFKIKGKKQGTIHWVFECNPKHWDKIKEKDGVFFSYSQSS